MKWRKSSSSSASFDTFSYVSRIAAAAIAASRAPRKNSWAMEEQGSSAMPVSSPAPVTSITSTSSRVQIYPAKSEFVSPFLREKYEKEASKNWDLFYKRNADRFFKDRHYLDKEWGDYIGGLDVDNRHTDGKRVILEVGCGTGNTVFPLLAEFPNIFVHACDFSARAVNLVKAHQEYNESQVNAFVCDVTSQDLTTFIQPLSVHVVTLVFMLSAVSPEKMVEVLQNLKRILKPGGYILVRDYAVGDLAQERLTSKDQKISENFFARGDGTRAYYFSEENLVSLFADQGLTCKAVSVHCRQVQNRARALVMNRRWIQGEFHLPIDGELNVQEQLAALELNMQPEIDSSILVQQKEVEEIDLSEGIAMSLFATTPILEITKNEVGTEVILAKCLSKENQHTIQATGLLLWDAAPALAAVLNANPILLTNKRVVELGCGATAFCSLIASKFATTIVATDGDHSSMKLLQENLQLNSETFPVTKVVCETLEWGKEEHINKVKSFSGNLGFELIVGTDVTYVAEAVPLLFATARELIAKPSIGCGQSMLMLCHFARKVAEGDILATAVANGFQPIDVWETTPRLVVPAGLEKLSLGHGPLRLLSFQSSE